MPTTRPSAAPRLTHTADELRRELAAARKAHQSVGLVATMGALHEGHLSLVDACRRECGLTVVTPSSFSVARLIVTHSRMTL